MSDDHAVLRNVRRALRRAAPLAAAPVPPAIEEPIVRLVHSEIGLSELFARTARANQMVVDEVAADELASKLVGFLSGRGCARVALSGGGLLANLRITDALAGAGISAKTWEALTLDELYDFDCGITDVVHAIAETGSLVIRGSDRHGRALSLVPPVHVAVVEPKNLLPDLMDLFELLSRDPHPPNLTIITGPSKTADIEMNLVTGVHGPGVVQVFLLV
jgi:L-lactate dehydrogenase complex protein LldG